MRAIAAPKIQHPAARRPAIGRWARTAAIAAALLAMPTLTWANQTKDKTCATVTMTGNPEYPPVTWASTNGDLTGSYVTFARMALEAIGVKAKALARGNWARAQLEVKRGNIDILVGPYYNADRDKWLYYVQPAISSDPNAIFMPMRHTFAFSTLEDLVGRRGVMQRGNSYGEEFDRFAHDRLSIYKVSELAQALRMLAQGRADYAPAGLYAGRLALTQLDLHDDIAIAPHYFSRESMYLAFSNRSPCRHLADRLSPVIRRLKADNTIPRLMDRYIDIYVQTH